MTDGSGEVCKVRLTGWRPGLKKITLMKIIVEATGRDLREAKGIVDRLVEGESTELDLLSEARALPFLEAVRSAGAEAELVAED